MPKVIDVNCTVYGYPWFIIVRITTEQSPLGTSRVAEHPGSGFHVMRHSITSGVCHLAPSIDRNIGTVLPVACDAAMVTGSPPKQSGRLSITRYQGNRL